MRLRTVFLASLFTTLLPLAIAQQQAPMTSPEERAALHRGPEWLQISPHLPDPKTATPAMLETAGDVLRARRFPEDALDFYGYAVSRGGNVSRLLNKIGVVRLELRQNELARQMFLRVVRANKKDSQAWNNLGVTEFATQNYGAAISDYRRALKVNQHSAVYHANLGMAYFEKKDTDSAQQQFTLAVQIDPGIMSEGEAGGATAHILGSQRYPDLCFEMAKMYARAPNVALMRLWLAKASEGGYDVRQGIRDTAVLRPYVNDPQIKMMLANSEAMRKRSVAAATMPSLGVPTDIIKHLDVD